MPRGSGREIRLFRAFGIDLTAHWSWGVLALLLALAGAQFFGQALGGAPPYAIGALAVLGALLALASIYLHELTHAVVARRLGLPVTRISLFLLGGIAHIPQDLSSPRQELLVSVSGPLTSLLLGILAVAAALTAGGAHTWVWAMGFWMAVTNLPLGIFNLVPAYPLDGGRVLRSLLWFAGDDAAWGSRIAAGAGQLTASALLIAGLWDLFGATTDPMGGIWLLFVGWFMYSGAMAAQQSARLVQALQSVTVAAVMRSAPDQVETGTSLQAFAERYLASVPSAARRGETPVFVVMHDGRGLGLLGLPQLRLVPSGRWATTTVDEVMLPLADAPTLAPDAAATGALHLLADGTWPQIPVVADGRLLGLVSHADLVIAAERARQRR